MAAWHVNGGERSSFDLERQSGAERRKGRREAAPFAKTRRGAGGPFPVRYGRHGCRPCPARTHETDCGSPVTVGAVDGSAASQQEDLDPLRPLRMAVMKRSATARSVGGGATPCTRPVSTRLWTPGRRLHTPAACRGPRSPTLQTQLRRCQVVRHAVRILGAVRHQPERREQVLRWSRPMPVGASVEEERAGRDHQELAGGNRSRSHAGGGGARARSGDGSRPTPRAKAIPYGFYDMARNDCSLGERGLGPRHTGVRGGVDSTPVASDGLRPPTPSFGTTLFTRPMRAGATGIGCAPVKR